jgi:plastocyanin
MRSSVLTICTVLISASACSSSTGTSGQVPANTVQATTSLTFNPGSLTVAVGASVSFVFQSVAHNVTFNAVTGRPADIGTSTNTTVARTFGAAGTFVYQCTIHAGMAGTVIVQ